MSDISLAVRTVVHGAMEGVTHSVTSILAAEG